MTSSPKTVYRSEIYIPVSKDTRTFADRQTSLFGDLESRMEHRRREWEEEVERMRRDFFRLKPNDKLARSSSQDSLLDGSKRLIVQDPRSGQPQFKVQFDVSEFKAEEISVSTFEHSLSVQARSEQADGGQTKIREFSRKVPIPENVDPHSLVCNLSSDGILCIEAPVKSPGYSTAVATASAPTLAVSPISSSNLGSRSEVTTTRTSQISSSMVGTRGVQSGPIVTGLDGTRKLQLEFEVKEYKPEEIQVRTSGNRLIIRALHEEKGGGRTVKREFNKEYDLPSNVDPYSLSAFVTEDSKLTIEAPIKETKPIGMPTKKALKYSVPVSHD